MKGETMKMKSLTFLLTLVLRAFVLLLCIFTFACTLNNYKNFSTLENACSTSDSKHSNKDSNTLEKGDHTAQLIQLNAIYDLDSLQDMSFTNNEEKTLKTFHREKTRDNPFNTEEYGRIYENNFKNTLQYPLSTFSIDVDTASYSNIRRFIQMNRLPPKDAVRIEEMINYFSYEYPVSETRHPFSVTTELSECPWNGHNKLVHIGLKGKTLDNQTTRPSNLVFLIDASGSMSSNNKLPLLKKSFQLLIKSLNHQDKIAIVTYANEAHLVLPSTEASSRKKILSAIHAIKASGSTSGSQGIQLAYDVAQNNYIAKGNNRVILATDGDFNVGVTSTGALVRLIEEKRRNNIYLTICGFGMGNYKDDKMEQISNAGNGNYFYIDTIREAEKVFVNDLRSTIHTIAKDVKLQVEFNPVKVKAYRLVGYENRTMPDEDFNDDTKDAGEIGDGHTVTALYEIIPAKSPQVISMHDQLEY